MDLGSDRCYRMDCQRIIEAAIRHCQTHGHASDNTLEDALIEAGLLDPKLADWRKKKP